MYYSFVHLGELFCRVKRELGTRERKKSWYLIEYLLLRVKKQRSIDKIQCNFHSLMATESPPPPLLSNLGPCELSWLHQSDCLFVWVKRWLFWSSDDDELRHHHRSPLPFSNSRQQLLLLVTLNFTILHQDLLSSGYLFWIFFITTTKTSVYLFVF